MEARFIECFKQCASMVTSYSNVDLETLRVKYQREYEEMYTWEDFICLNALRMEEVTKLDVNLVFDVAVGPQGDGGERCITKERFLLYSPVLRPLSSQFCAVEVFRLLRRDQTSIQFPIFSRFFKAVTKEENTASVSKNIIKMLSTLQESEKQEVLLVGDSSIGHSFLCTDKSVIIQYPFGVRSIKFSEIQDIESFDKKIPLKRLFGMQFKRQEEEKSHINTLFLLFSSQEERDFYHDCFTALVSGNSMIDRHGPKERIMLYAYLVDDVTRMKALYRQNIASRIHPASIFCSSSESEDKLLQGIQTTLSKKSSGLLFFSESKNVGNYLADDAILDRLREKHFGRGRFEVTGRVLEKQKFDKDVLKKNAIDFLGHVHSLRLFSFCFVYIQSWEDPVLSGFLFSFFLFLVYNDAVSYLPGLFFLVHALLLLWMRTQHLSVEEWCEQTMKVIEDNESKEEEDRKKDDTEAESKATVHRLSQMFPRINQIREMIKKTTNVLETIQNTFAILNYRFWQVHSIYMWHSYDHSMTIVLASLFCFFLLTFISFRLLFLGGTLGFFLDYWITPATPRKNKKTMSKRIVSFLNSVPPRIPEESE